MRCVRRIAAAVVAAFALSSAASATIGGYYYAVQYDFREFWAATDGKNFQVILAGNPFPEIAADDVARRMLPVMQANKPRPALTFTYDKPAEDPRPYYRLVLVFDAANDLGGDRVCRGETHLKPHVPGILNVFAVYCRNDMVMSMTTGWTAASGPDDPRVGQLYKDLFAVVFSDSMALRPQNGSQRF